MQYQTSLLRGQPDDEAIKMIRYYEGLALEFDPRGYCVCTSEGKDSRVLGHLMRRAGVKHFYLHSITGIDPPELVYFQRRNFTDYEAQGYLTYDVMHAMSIFALMLEKLFPPLRQIRYCCEHLKERQVPQTGNAIMCMGVRKFESSNRMKKRNELEIAMPKGKSNIIMPFDNHEHRQTFETCYRDNQHNLNPIAYWRDEDIWNYSADVKLEQCSLYCEGFDRLGCIGCPMAREYGRRKEFERWLSFKKPFIHTLDRIIIERKRRGLPCYVNAGNTGEEWFEWWLTDKAQEITDPDQIEL